VRSNTVIAFNNPGGIDNAKVRKIMDEQYNVVISPGAGKLKDNIFRIGCMGIISETETFLTVNALENALTKQGYRFEKGAGLEAAREKFHYQRPN
jgi:aspartate aminotransferase-like enzyme